MTDVSDNIVPGNNGLRGRIALVTGSGGGRSGGIGAGIARCLGAGGATVIVNDLDEASAQRTVDTLAEIGANGFTAVGDVADSVVASAIIDRVEEEIGALDILVNNAGIVGRSSVVNTSDEEWSRVLRVNLDGLFVISRALLPRMQNRGYGRIINIASIAGIRTSYLGGIAYTASN